MPLEDAPGYDLERFVRAQDAGGSYGRAVEELRRGRKESHWIWYVFPQVAGLGRSDISRRYAISSLGEARAYLRHRVLGPRLRECAGIVVAVEGSSAAEIFGPLDAQKFRSCMTLFHRAAPSEALFRLALERYFDGDPDPATDRFLAR
ncbi:MAG: DUF1810 domain-containing protein [Acidimicrobiales bacterium]